MDTWHIYNTGTELTGIQAVNIINTISGSAKFELILSDVSHINDIDHFSDIEIMIPTREKPRGGLIFNGTDNYVMLDETVRCDSDDWAISWWMKRSGTRHENIFSWVVSGGLSGRIDIDESQESITVESRTNGVFTTTLSSGITTSDGNWHHYVLDFNSTNTILYVDGNLASTGSKNTDSVDFEIQYIGHQQSQPGYGNWFTGSLAHIYIFDNSITADEVEDLYNGEHINTAKNYYTFDESYSGADAIYDRQEISHGQSYPGALSVDTSPINTIIAFKGRVDELIPDYDTDTVTITGRDYIGELLARAVVESYGDPTPVLRSYMVDDIVSKYGTSMSRAGIDASPAGTECEYLFKTSAWDAIVKCATDDGYRFFCDVDKNFNYHEKGWRESNVTIQSGVDDILGFNVIESGTDIVNAVMVFGYDDGAGNQVLVLAEDLDSQSYYGSIFEKRIVDLSIMTEEAANDYAYNYLSNHAYVLEIVELDIIGAEILIPGDLITLKLPSVNIDNSFLIIDKLLKYPDNITTIRVAKYTKNLESMIGKMADKILMLERYFMDENATAIKLLRINEAVGYTECIKLEKRALDDSFKIGISGWSTIGTTKIGGRGSDWQVFYSDCGNVVDGVNNVVDGADNVMSFQM